MSNKKNKNKFWQMRYFTLLGVVIFWSAFQLQNDVLAQVNGSSASVQVQQKLVFDRVALQQAVKQAELIDGKQSAQVYGKVILQYSNGVREEKDGIFEQSMTKGVYSNVSVQLVNIASFIGHNLWMMVAAFLVFVMHLGFAMLESGLTQAKNTVNILFKNTTIIAIGILSYAVIGFNLMYPGNFGMIADVLGFNGFGVGTDASGVTALYNPGYTYWTDFLFQAMFAATAATIVSGAVAERIKLSAFLLFSVLFVSLIYPIIGSWKWGGGFLDKWGFYDFAGSTLVHSVGGWGALAGVLLLGPRLGKYLQGQSKIIPASNMPLATIGVFLLWLGWFGFNGGSVLSADPGNVSYVLVTTCIAAAAGIMGAILLTHLITRSMDLSMALNGALAGLVGITASADCVSLGSASLIGLSSGFLVVLSILMFDKLHIDDPVGAISVHLVCGIWGTLCVGLFSQNPEHGFMQQLIGVLLVGVTAFPLAFLFFYALKLLCGLRVKREDELKGLDISEHKQEAYGGFQVFDLR